MEQMSREFGAQEGYTRAEEEYTDFEEIESKPKSMPTLSTRYYVPNHCQRFAGGMVTGV